MNTKNIFKRGDWKSDKVLVCHECLETLFISDIEHFEKCPYCNASIEMDVEIEDYILKPVVDRWISIQKSPGSSLEDSYSH
jgi:hypothetical protein